MTDSITAEERLRIALRGAEYFAATAAMDLYNSDRDELAVHLQQLRLVVIAGLQAFKALPSPVWPNAETREAFGAAAMSWRDEMREDGMSMSVSRDPLLAIEDAKIRREKKRIGLSVRLRDPPPCEPARAG